MKRHIITIVFIVFLAAAAYSTEPSPKREFRGAWISTVYQDKYLKRGTDANKAYLRSLLDSLQAAGINAVMFQARPSADAFYDSPYEPWSRFISSDGKAPTPAWDPLQFMVDEAHARGMELHAWINPYRVTTSKGQRPLPGHIYYKEPERFVTYEGDGRMYFDPGRPDNREFITKVITDIVDRYDVDGIHFDDYFYPYPAGGKDFPDSKSYAAYGNGMNRADWRRANVDSLISSVHTAIRKSSRPWVRFGISPFGVWRNKTSDPRGSDTRALQNYDDLYADALNWAQQGWIDYLLPQLYWELEHPRASYATLVRWWPSAVPDGFHLYIGQDVERTMSKPDIQPSAFANQLHTKVDMTRSDSRILGNCWWPAFSVADNYNGALDSLRLSVQAHPALVPQYTAILSGAPAKVKHVKLHDNTLTWKAASPHGKISDPVRFVVYCCPKPDADAIADPANIVAIIPGHEIKISKPGYYTVTALDRVNNESKPSSFVHLSH